MIFLNVFFLNDDYFLHAQISEEAHIKFGETNLETATPHLSSVTFNRILVMLAQLNLSKYHSLVVLIFIIRNNTHFSVHFLGFAVVNQS